MADKKETIADIIAEKRALADRLEHEMAVAKECKELTAHRTAQAIIDSTHREADRIEAAWKREREVTKPAENVNSGASSDTAGNCAKLRDALVSIKALTELHAHELSELGTVYRTAKAFLKGVGDADK